VSSESQQLIHCIRIFPHDTTENRQQLVEFFVERSNNRNTIRVSYFAVFSFQLLFADSKPNVTFHQDDYLKAMPDFQRISKKFLAGRATLEDVVRVYQAVTKLPEILDTLMEIGRERKQKQWVISDEVAATLMDETYCVTLSVRFQP
jgi:DNA mismatch repair ATPase MutS